MSTVKIKKGFLAYVFLAATTFIGLWLMNRFFQAVIEQIAGVATATPGQFIGFSLFTSCTGLFFLYAALLVFRQEYAVSLEGIEVKRLWRSRFISWQEVEVFGEMPTFVGVSSYYVQLKDGTSASFLTAFLGRPERSAKALIEAAYLADSNIEFKFLLGNEYGHPPYGIFEETRS